MPYFSRPVLYELTHELVCFLLVKINIRSRHSINHCRIRIIEFADQDVPVNVRDHRDLMAVSTVAEPGCIVFSELSVNRFQSAFLWVTNCYLHGVTFLGFPFSLRLCLSRKLSQLQLMI
jgi:hypothetical protein